MKPRGYDRLNKRHMNISCYNRFQFYSVYISNMTYKNDLYYENHDVKLLKDKQIIDFVGEWFGIGEDLLDDDD